MGEIGFGCWLGGGREVACARMGLFDFERSGNVIESVLLLCSVDQDARGLQGINVRRRG